MINENYMSHLHLGPPFYLILTGIPTLPPNPTLFSMEFCCSVGFYTKKNPGVFYTKKNALKAAQPEKRRVKTEMQRTSRPVGLKMLPEALAAYRFLREGSMSQPNMSCTVSKNMGSDCFKIKSSKLLQLIIILANTNIFVEFFNTNI